MLRFSRLACLSLLLGLTPLGTAPAQGAAYDPKLTWRTLTTEHFRIQFHGGEEALAEQAAAALETAWSELTEELKTRPRRRIEVVLVDRTDAANGYAQTVPLNTIVIYVTAPGEDSTLSHYEDWNETILTHELTHILHIDLVEGLPRVPRALFGRIISVNRLSPGWVVEGFATFQETRQTHTGRGRSTVADMIKRMAVLEGDFPPLGSMDGWVRDPPGGNLRYLFGQDFIQYVSEVAGEEAWTDFIHMYGRGLPYLLPGRRAFGKRLVALHRDWKAHAEAHYGAQARRIEEQGIVEGQRLSPEGQRCASPAWSPDGSRLVYSCVDPRRGPNITLADGLGENPEIELSGRSATSFAWRPDGEAFAFSSARVVNRYNVWNDLNLYTIEGGVESLTRGKRARDPAFSPDGTVLLTVTNALQNNQLARLTVDRDLVDLTKNEDATQYSTPRFSPDGRFVALSVWQEGYRDLWLFTPDGQPWRQLTEDLASDIDPAWSADGRTLYFSSDRTGVYNIWALDLETERLRQVTNVLGGAFHPAPHPHGDGLAFESFHSQGARIQWLPQEQARGWDGGPLPSPTRGGPALAEVLPREGHPGLAERREAAVRAREAVLAKRAAERGESAPVAPSAPEKGRETAPEEVDPWKAMPLVERPNYPGLSGWGAPFDHARRWGGPWGLPEEPPLGDPALAGLPRVKDAPEQVLDEQRAARVELQGPKEEDYPFTWPVGRYSPWGSLLPPRYLMPTITSTTFGYQGMLSTSGADTLRRWLYSGYLSYRTDARHLGWGASLAWNRYTPILTVGAYSYAVPYGDIYVGSAPPEEGGAYIPSVESKNERYWDRRIRGYAQVTHPIDEYRSVFGRWSGTSRQPLGGLPEDAWRAFLPTRGFISSVGGGWRYARGQAYEYSISPEKGRILSVVGDLSSPWIGAFVLDDQDRWVGFTQLQLTADWREYIRLPWAANHVLATKLAGGVSAGDENRYGSYRLGGSFGESAYYTLPDEWRALRGFPAAVVYGDNYYLGSAEYRLPLWYVDRGLPALPFFARGVAAAAFIDAGNAFDDPGAPEAWQGLRSGVGGELSASAVLGWGVPVTVRLGYAFGLLGQGGYAPGSLEGAYAWLGSSF